VPGEDQSDLVDWVGQVHSGQVFSGHGTELVQGPVEDDGAQ
jgi:hypothetical protein